MLQTTAGKGALTSGLSLATPQPVGIQITGCCVNTVTMAVSPAEILLILACLCSVTGQFRATRSPSDGCSLTSNLPGEPRLICPTKPIQAIEGAKAILRCCLDPPLDLTARTVDMKRLDLQDQDHVVLSYRHGRDHLDPQMPEYRNKTTLDHEGLARGIITVSISPVNVSDNGTFRFYIPSLKTSSNIHLNVAKPTGQPKEPKRFDSTTTRPPVEDMTESEHRGPTGDVWKTVVPVVVVVVVGGALLLVLLVKCGVIKKCWQWPRGRRNKEANTINDFELDHLKTSSADNNNPGGHGENGV